jgi:putative transposase
MGRLVLSDEQWERISGLIIGRPDQCGSTGRDNQMFVETTLWIVRTGAPWRDLPEVFGVWNSVFRRFNRWSQFRRVATRYEKNGAKLPRRRNNRCNRPWLS